MDIRKVLCTSWSYAKEHVNSTHLIAFSLGVITICFLDAWVFEKSIADWVSATSTFGTLVVAYAVYRKAPEWLGKKLDEESISLATDIHFTLHDDIANESTRIRNILYYKDKPAPFSTTLIKIFNPDKNLGAEEIKKLKCEFTEHLKNNAFSELAKYQIDLIKKTKRLRFMRWKPTDYNQYLINRITNHITPISFERQKLTALINPLLAIIESTASPKGIDDTLDEIARIENIMISNTKELLRYIDEYKCQHGDVIDYFERADKKPVNK